MRASFDGPPPLFNQGVSARARVAFFSFLAIALIIIDSRVRMLETVRVGLGVVLYPVQQVLLVPSRLADTVTSYFTSVTTLDPRKRRAKAQTVRNRAITAAGARADGRKRTLAQAARRARTTRQCDRACRCAVRVARSFCAQAGSECRAPTKGYVAGSPVIDDAGVVGQITRVFNDSCEVTLLTDKDQSIPVQILRNGLRGVAFGGAEPGTLDLRFMAPNADVVNGDVVTTSGIDGVYPSGLMVATVSRVERAAKDQFARIVMSPVAGIESNKHLLVLLVEPAKLSAPPAVAPLPARKGARK